MSRSYRKPYYIVPQKSRFKTYCKKLYNKRLRHLPLEENFSYMKFRKYNCSYDIKDWIAYIPTNKKLYRK